MSEFVEWKKDIIRDLVSEFRKHIEDLEYQLQNTDDDKREESSAQLTDHLEAIRNLFDAGQKIAIRHCVYDTNADEETYAVYTVTFADVGTAPDGQTLSLAARAADQPDDTNDEFFHIEFGAGNET